MRERTPSYTASLVAAARSFGELLPEHARLADDPYGIRFAGRHAERWLARLRKAPAFVRENALTRGQLGRGVLYLQVRTRVIDDHLREFVSSGGKQIVLLGAGYDCRAIRHANMLGDAIVYEVDHPATQAYKRKRLTPPACVRHLAWDFEKRALDELPSALAALGHDATKPTLTIWEGVTMYLTPEAISASVAAVRAYSSLGSPFVLTYFEERTLRTPPPTVRLFNFFAARGGEPLRFGFDPRELSGWLSARGFSLEQDESCERAATRLLPGPWARKVAYDWRHFALARRV